MSIALYRRYRPARYSEVVGQDHVTLPLRRALRADRVHHAYLFSGPRGCGKTTSARILALTLNCHARVGAVPGEFPDEPCGTCPSCRDVANGSSLDVIEIDAASHNGVDDARELRERAVFAPARDKYKIFVVDEAHMVTSAGFNALLKIVEEPPEHVRFVFATTEPDKVIGTIRSRTHHYPFRLIGSDVLSEHLLEVAGREGITLGEGVLPLIVRSGAGSARDAMSVLDQLCASAQDNVVTYDHATSLLGFTHASLLDDTVMALARKDGAAAFDVAGRVVGAGHDARRFTEDLLERFRDVLVVQATGKSAGALLPGAPADQLERMREQAEAMGAAQLSWAAEVTNDALTQMVGATSPRLHLELLMAKLLLPGADGERGALARLDRLERQGQALGAGVGISAPAVPPVQPTATVVPTADAVESVSRSAAMQPANEPQPVTESPVAAPPQPQVTASPAAAPAPTAAPHEARATQPHAAASEPAHQPEPPRPQSPAAAPAQPAGDAALALRNMWQHVLHTMEQKRRITWSALQHATVADVRDGTVFLHFSNPGAYRMFGQRDHATVTAEVIYDVMALKVSVTATMDGAGPSTGGGGAPPGPKNAPWLAGGAAAHSESPIDLTTTTPSHSAEPAPAVPEMPGAPREHAQSSPQAPVVAAPVPATVPVREEVSPPSVNPVPAAVTPEEPVAPPPAPTPVEPERVVAEPSFDDEVDTSPVSRRGVDTVIDVLEATVVEVRG